MEITFNELKEKDVINVADGKRLGRVEDVIFEKDDGKVIGVIIPGERKLFKKREDVFVPIEELRRIGEDVILVKILPENSVVEHKTIKDEYKRLKMPIEKEK